MSRLLVVEDNQQIRTMLKTMGDMINMEVVFPDSFTKEGLKKALEDEGGVRLVISDGNLETPGFDGESVVKVVREILSDIPIVAYTSDYYLGSRMLSAGAQVLISKPAPMRILLGVLKGLSS